MYLLDTNVVSQLAKRAPNPGVIDFIEDAKRVDAPPYLSVLSIGEINKGIVKLARYGDHQQAANLQRWLAHIKEDFSDCLLPIDSDVSELWGAILGATDDTNAIDKLIAATALLYDLTVVTRNVDHLMPTGVKSFNPFR